MKRLAIVSTHPIQYNAPLFKMLASAPGLAVKVFYTLGEGYTELKDRGFGKAIAWDIPLLEGYDYQFLENAAIEPGTSHHKGIRNPSIIQSLQAFDPTAILVYGWHFESHLKVLRHFKNRVPPFFRGDSTLLDERQGVRSILRRLVLTWVYRHVDKAFYVGTHNKAYYLKHGLRERALVFAPHAIDNARFGEDAPYKEEGKRIRSTLGVPADHVLFLFTGKFEHKKSPLLLIRAFQRMSQPHLSLLLVGNGQLEEEMKKEAQGNARIHFLPFQNQGQMPAVYRAADVLVLPSGGPGETWGLSVNEAMACGRPVIASDKVGCAVDLVREHVNGYIFKAGDMAGLIEKLSLCAAKTKDELRQMGTASRNSIADWSFREACRAIVSNVPEKA